MYVLYLKLSGHFAVDFDTSLAILSIESDFTELYTTMSVPHIRPSIQAGFAKDYALGVGFSELSRDLHSQNNRPNIRTDWTSWNSLLSALLGQDVTSVLYCWQSELNSSTTDEITLMLNDLHSAIQEGITSLKLILSTHDRRHEQHTDALLSVCLIETLQEAITSFCSTYRIVSSYAFSGWHSFELKSLETQMVSCGWCPNHVEMCRKVFGLAALIFSSTLSRPFQRTHPDCSKLQCVAYKVDERRVTKHRFEGCCCSFAGSNEGHLCRLITLGAIPLVRIDWAHTTGPEVTIVPFDGEKSFVAVSHVWSHGLANASCNALPKCQLDRICTYVNSIEGSPSYVWIDTLCVPRQPFALRRAAIQGIRRVYEEASSVLVLDEELMACQLRRLSLEAKLMLINLSGWMRRLWTLHEHMRARILHFQFADGTCSDQELLEQHAKNVALQRKLQIPSHNVLASRAISLLSNASALKTETNELMRMTRMWYLLRWRHLSWAEDETILMANMLGVPPENVNLLLKMPKKKRMQRFLNLFHEFPAELVFLQVPKIKTRGQGWAPASWLHCMEHLSEQSTLKADAGSMSVRTKDGLLVRCPWLELETSDTAIFGCGREIHLTVANLGTACAVRGYRCHRYLTRRRNKQRQRLAICLEKCYGMGKGPPDDIRGALVVRETGALSSMPVRARLLRNVVVHFRRERRNQQQTSIESTTEQDSESVDLVEAIYMHESEQWCIG